MNEEINLVDVNKLTIYNEVNRSLLNSELNLDEIIDLILNRSLELTNASYGSLLLRDKKDQTKLVVKATTHPKKFRRQSEIGKRLAIKDSLCGLPVIERRGIIVHNAQKNPFLSSRSRELNMQDVLSVPMFDGGKIIGVLKVECPKPDAFQEEHKSMLSILAGQASIALQQSIDRNKLIHDQMILDALHEIDLSMLNPNMDLEDTLEIVLNEGLKLIGADYGNLLLRDDKEPDWLIIRATTTQISKLRENELGKRLEVKKSISGLPVVDGKPHLIDNVTEHKNYVKVLREQNMQSELVVPLKYAGYVIGVINVESPELAFFRNEHERILTILAGQASIAIQQFKAREDLIHNRRAVEALHKIDLSILNPRMDLDDTLNIVLQESLKLIGADFGNLLLIDEDDEKMLVIRATTTQKPSWRRKELGKRLPIDKSISGLPIRDSNTLEFQYNRRGVIIDNVQKHKLYVRVLRDKKMQSELVVPLLEGGTPLGVLNIESPELAFFTNEHRQLLRILAGQAAIAIRMKERQEELLHKEKVLQVLHEIDRSVLHPDHSLDDTLDFILHESLKLIGAEFGNLLLVDETDEKEDTLIIRATTTRDEKLREEELGQRLSISKTISGLPIFNHRADGTPVSGLKGVIIDDVQAHPKYVRVLRDQQMQSELVVPLVIGNSAIGVINVENPIKAFFKPKDERLLTILAGQAAIAIRVARLLTRAERRAKLLTAAAQVSRQISAILDLDALLIDAVNTICEHFELYYAGIFFVDPTENWLVLKAGSGDAGIKLIAEGYRFEIDQSSMSGSAVISESEKHSPDVSTEAAHRKNRYLPETQSEMAIPLIFGSETLGVLSLQSQHQGGFHLEEREAFKIVSDQLSVAIRNAKYSDEIGRIRYVHDIGRIAGRIFHDYASSATTILEYLKYVEDYLGETDDSLTEWLNMIRNGAQHIDSVRNTVLDPNKKLILEKADINEILERCFTSVRVVIPDDVEFIHQLADIPLPVKVDVQRLSNLIENILDNAVKAMKDNQKRKKILTVRTGIEKDLHEVDEVEEYIRVEIEDTGCGISEDNIEKIWFDGYTASKGGHGWGLADALSLISDLDSKIFVESDVGVGTTFTILIPKMISDEVSTYG